MARKSKYSPEVRERAVRLVTETRPSHESKWAAITSVAAKMGCKPETLLICLRQSQRHASARPGGPGGTAGFGELEPRVPGARDPARSSSKSKRLPL